MDVGGEGGQLLLHSRTSKGKTRHGMAWQRQSWDTQRQTRSLVREADPMRDGLRPIGCARMGCDQELGAKMAGRGDQRSKQSKQAESST